jgi:hypothetical protein
MAETLTRDEINSDSKAADEAVRQTNELSDEYIVEQIEACKQESEDATRDERQIMRDLFDMWEGWRDFSKKEPWQNKIAVEKPFTAVEQATAQIQRALFDSPNFLQFTSEGRAGLIPVTEWETYIRRTLSITAFPQKFIDAVQIAFIMNVSGYVKPRWREYSLTLPSGQRQTASFLHLTVIPPWRIYRDPDSTPRDPWSGSYIIHSDWSDIGILRASPNTVNIDKLTTGDGDASGIHPEDKGRVKEWKRSKFRHAVVVDEYWGDLVNENGDVVLPDALTARVGKTLIRKAAINPIWSIEPTNGRRRWPLIAFSPFTHPLRFEGRGILQQSWRLAQFYENVFNIAGDGLAFTIFSGLQGDLSRLSNPTDTAIRPSKFWALKAGQSPDALKIVESGRMDVNAVLAFMQHIDQVYQNNSFVSDFVIGLPGYRSDITKGEVQLKTAQSLSIFDRMGKSIEAGGQHIVSLIYDMLVQYTDETTLPIIGNAISDDTKALLITATPEQRWQQMRADMQIHFAGITQALQRDQQLQRGLQMSAILKDPAYLGLVQNPGALLEKLIDLIGFKGLIQMRPGGMTPTVQASGTIPPGSQTPPGAVQPPRAPRSESTNSIARQVNRGGPTYALDRNQGG